MFRKSQLAWIAPYAGPDTIYYISANDDVDALIIEYVSPTISHCEDCCAGIKAPRYQNDKRVAIRNYRVEKETGEFIHHADTTGLQKWSIPQWIIVIRKYPDNQEFDVEINFRGLISDLDASHKPIHRDSVQLSKGRIANFYLLKSRYPERVVDSLDIEEISWSKKEGLLGYKNKGGLEFIREDLVDLPKEMLKPKVLIVPCANGYNYDAHMGTVNSFIEAAMDKQTDVEHLPFPYKAMQGSGYHGVYKASDCKALLEKSEADVLVMTKMLGDIHTHLSEPEGTWGYRTKILNRHTMKETKSIHAKNLAEFKDLEQHVNQNIETLMSDILNSYKDE